MTAKLREGTIKWFDEKKGFGFIESDEKDSPIFLHFSAVPKSKIKDLKKGTKVRFKSDLDGEVVRAKEVETL